jgi:PKD repeat protein
VLTDNHGCFDTLTTSVLAPKPIDSFNFTPVSGCAPLMVTFTDHSTSVPGATINNYVWKFGNGQSAVTTTPSTTYVYTANGTYAVKQIVTDNVGCKDSLVRHTRVTANKPTAVFTASVTSVCARRNVRFTNTTAGTFTCLWLFGDGDTSTTVSPLHSYAAAGTYTVKLIVVSPAGCRDTLTKSNYITVRPLPRYHLLQWMIPSRSVLLLV